MSTETPDVGHLMNFGEFVRFHREALGISLRGLAKELNITASYMSDIEKGNRPAPRGLLDALCTALKLDKDGRDELYDLAADTRDYQYDDINPYLKKERLARVALRLARDTDFPAEGWEDVIQRINGRRNTDT